MQYLLNTYAMAQEAFQAKPANPKSDSVTYQAQGNFFRSFKEAGALLARHKAQTGRRADKAVVRENTQRLADITSLFLKRLPVYPWDAYELENVFNHEVFNPRQKKALKDAFEHALARDGKADPRCMNYRFVNPHQFKRGGKTIDVFAKVITENFDAMFAQDPYSTMMYAAQMSHIANKQGERQRFVKLMMEYAPRYDEAYRRVDGEDETKDPFLKLAMLQAGTKNQSVAIQLLEDRIAHLAKTAKAHKKPQKSQHVLTVPSETDDLHFDAFDAILNMVLAVGEVREGRLELLKSTRRVFARHFDALAELNASKAFIFATALHDRISYFRNGTPLAIEAAKFQKDITGLMATNLLGKVERVKYMLGYVDVVEAIMHLTDNEGVQSLVIDHIIEKAKASSKYDPDINSILLDICEKTGNQHPRFFEMADLIVANETGNQDTIAAGSVNRLIELAGMMDGRHSRRLKVLQAASSVTEILGRFDPLAAEKHFKAIVEACNTAKEKKLAHDIETRAVAAVVSVRPVPHEDAAIMKRILMRYNI